MNPTPNPAPKDSASIEVTTTKVRSRVTFSPSDLYTNLDWGSWIYGVFSGFISGGATAATGGIVVGSMDSKEFAFGGWRSLELMMTLFVVSGTLNCFNYLKTHPLPEMKTKDGS